jgi:hypothetical protein
LIACVKRFRQDYRTGKTTKVLDNVQLASTLKLPTINADPKLMDIVFDGKIQEWKQVLNARYGLYAVIVHRGSRLTGGHYYAYTRDSDADLSQIDDAVLAPWVCMNDAKLTVTSWDKLNESTATSMDDTAYMLMYRLLEADELPDAHLGPNPLLRTNSEMVRTVLANKHNNTNQINPSVALEVMEDNTAYVKEVMANSSDLFLSHAHAIVRQNANYHEPLLAGVDTKANFDRSGVEAGACVLCLSPEHEAEACPFSQYTMAECPDCCVQVLKIFQDQHNSICLKRNTN